MICGMDVLLEERLTLLRGRRVALLSHQAALVRGGAASAQALRRVLGRSLVALFGPEHGFCGTEGAGEPTHTERHPEWGIPVYSLYGERRAPSPEMLADVDVVVCDLQDLGVRCYTYLATLRNMARACRDAGVDLIVTDRPVPLPLIVDGPMLDPALESFVAPCPLPMVYGMTPGETLRWMSEREGASVPPAVVAMRGWSRSDAPGCGSGAGGFMPPSPGIVSAESACAYAALVFSEALAGIDCGRGTNLAFRLFGAPWIEGERLCALLNRKKMGGVAFHPHRYVAAAGHWKGRALSGVRLCVHTPALFRPVECSLRIIRELSDCYGDSRVWRGRGVRQRWFDKLYGDSATRRDLLAGKSLSRIFGRWRAESAEFSAEREAALLYR